MRIAVIADTHNLLRPGVIRAASCAELILHAGDICHPDILETLQNIAPLHTVRGNNDRGAWADALPTSLSLTLGGIHFLMVHDLKGGHTLPTSSPAVVISGHSHKLQLQKNQDLWFLNPGAAGPRRFKLPASMAIVEIAQGQPHFHFLHLD